jgi:hypothetical protein
VQYPHKFEDNGTQTSIYAPPFNVQIPQQKVKACRFETWAAASTKSAQVEACATLEH